MIEADGSLDEAVAQETGEGRYQVVLSAGGQNFLADEPREVGGLGSGPTPYQLIGSALAACTTMTLRLYADRKRWPVRRIGAAVGHRVEEGSPRADVFTCRISLDGDLEPGQRERLLEIAERCPVHRTLSATARIETAFGDKMPRAGSADSHMVDMEALIDVGRGSYDFTG